LNGSSLKAGGPLVLSDYFNDIRTGKVNFNPPASKNPFKNRFDIILDFEEKTFGVIPKTN
jgi:hypothetical protein